MERIRAQLSMSPQFARKFQCMTLDTMCKGHRAGISMGQYAYEVAQAFLGDDPDSMSATEYLSRMNDIEAEIHNHVYGTQRS